MPRFRVALMTVGCRANQADTDSLVRGLDPTLVKIAATPDAADLVVVNTCCVTAEAERDSRKAVRKALAASPGGRVVAVGCAAVAAPGFGFTDSRVEVRAVEASAADLVAWINDLAGSAGPPDVKPRREPAGRRRNRALLKVQSGCSRGCAYCVVPMARGRERSLPLGEALDRASRLAGEGFLEVVVTGVQLGAWGRDLPGRPRLAALVAALADRVAPGRVRLSSVEPWSVDDELIEVMAGHGRVCPHLHVPLQSGSDRILDRMGRGYRAADVVDLAARIRSRIPDVALGTDVLCGFPGEDEDAFGETLDAIERMAPAYVHAFGFSPRPGTRACGFEDRTLRSTVRERVRAVRAAGETARAAFWKSQAGRAREVVTEGFCRQGLRGLTDNYVPVLIHPADREIEGLVFARLAEGIAAGRVPAVPVDASGVDPLPRDLT